jgi:UDP-GlcNAc:undecaprenyl-phosphate GlcNAc-1-phosphate transferase
MSFPLSMLMSFAVTTVLLFGLRPLAYRVGLLDTPTARKVHAGQVPLIGGIAMFVGFAMSVLTLDVGLTELRPFFAASALLVMVGLLDDFHELSSRARFAAQILAATMMVGWGDVLLANLGHITPTGKLFELGAWTVPISVFCTVGVINALNMSDGVDGLAGGLALVAIGGLSVVAARPQADVLALLASVVVAFLMLNIRIPGRHRALVFMGDAGSMFLGFAITWFVISLSQGPQRVMAPVIALWFLMVPLFDTVWLLLKRPLSGRWPTTASHDHLHHVMQMAGLSPVSTVAAIWMLSLSGAGFGLWAHGQGIEERYLFAGFLALFAVYCLIMGIAWRWRRLLWWPMDRRLGSSERRMPDSRRQSDRRKQEDRRTHQERRL